MSLFDSSACRLSRSLGIAADAAYRVGRYEAGGLEGLMDRSLGRCRVHIVLAPPQHGYSSEHDDRDVL